MTPRANTRLKIWLVVLGVFVLGGITGAALDSVYRLRASSGQRPAVRRHDKDEMFGRMKAELNLSESQENDIRAILEQTRNEYKALRGEVRPRYDAIRQAARTKIRGLLNAEQQQKFDAKIAERDARAAERDGKRDRDDR
jgi:Spy/CpxP family protein refolding chaperone